MSIQIINNYSSLLEFKIKYRNEYLSEADVEVVRKLLEEAKETRILLNSLLLFIGEDINQEIIDELGKNRQNKSGCNHVLIRMITLMIN